MDFIAQIKQLAERVNTLKDTIQTEEATKTAMIMPFFQLLDYDVFNPLEFVPEYVADVGIKKGEKVDYAIMIEDNPVILIEAKHCAENLDKHGSQLFRYFATSSAKFGILTNGIIYRFYTDIDKENTMDDKPFLEINMLDLKDNAIAELAKFKKANFDLANILSSASDLKYTQQIKQLLATEYNEPSEEFISFVLNNGVYDGRKTQTVIDNFKPIVKKAFASFVRELMNDRLQNALDEKKPVEEKPIEEEPVTANQSQIITTEEEIEAYCIIKMILKPHLDNHTLTYKDTVNYFGILIDGKVTKWLCRLKLFNKKIMILPPEKDNIKIELSSIDDLYNYKDLLIQTFENTVVSKSQDGMN